MRDLPVSGQRRRGGESSQQSENNESLHRECLSAKEDRTEMALGSETIQPRRYRGTLSSNVCCRSTLIGAAATRRSAPLVHGLNWTLVKPEPLLPLGLEHRFASLNVVPMQCPVCAESAPPIPALSRDFIQEVGEAAGGASGVSDYADRSRVADVVVNERQQSLSGRRFVAPDLIQSPILPSSRPFSYLVAVPILRGPKRIR
jgi:hypothetical protein